MSSQPPDTRRRLLDAARRLIDDPQAPELRMADIARAAGVSRQALYLHFATRAELMIAVARDIDTGLDLDRRLAESRAAATGPARLDAFIRFWAGYLPEIARAARTLLRLRHTDPAAAAAWDDRMAAMREGCAAAVALLDREGRLAPGLPPATATDLLWTMLSFESWERLTGPCGWNGEDYAGQMRAAARRLLLRTAPGDQ